MSAPATEPAGIPDSWPDCACHAGSPQMLEHTPTGCSVIPTIIHDAVAADRSLSNGELHALVDAEEKRRRRGYRGLSGEWWPEVVDRLRSDDPIENLRAWGRVAGDPAGTIGVDEIEAIAVDVAEFLLSRRGVDTGVVPEWTAEIVMIVRRHVR